MIEGFTNNIIEGDCLEVMPQLPDRSIDMVLCDLPYGLTQNKWDTVIDLERLWEQYSRLIKPNGVIALTGQGKFTASLIQSKRKWFRYKIVWIKSKATNFLNAHRQPLRRHEDICIFYQKQPLYNPQKTFGKPYSKGMRKDSNSGSYGNYNTSFVKNETGMRFPTDVLFFEEEKLSDWVYFKTAETEGAFHPTQKPVNLGRWLIRTYTRPGEIVLDNACGSGSFMVAALLEGRHFVGIEKNDRPTHFGKGTDLIAISNKRILEAKLRIGLGL